MATTVPRNALRFRVNANMAKPNRSNSADPVSLEDHRQVARQGSDNAFVVQARQHAVIGPSQRGKRRRKKLHAIAVEGEEWQIVGQVALRVEAALAVVEDVPPALYTRSQHRVVDPDERVPDQD